MRGSTFKYETKKGRRWGYVFPNHPGGKPKQIRRGGFLTRREAEAAKQAQMVARRADDYIEPSAMLMRDYLADWLRNVEPTVSPATLHSYRDQVAHLSAHLGTVPLGSLSAPIIADAYRALGKQLAPSTLRITHTVLRASLTQAVRWRLRRDNPAQYVTLPAPVSKEETVWTKAEAARFLAHTADDPDHALWRVLLSTGMRLGEALALVWGAVDLDVGRVAVVRTLSKGADERVCVVERTKTESGRRTLDLDPATIAALRQHRVRQKEQRLRAKSWHDAGLVFTRAQGQAMYPYTVRCRLARACAEADVPHLTPKALRHTAATLMVANGVSMHAIKGILGHSNITLTMDLYSHRSAEATKDGLAVLARLLGDEAR